MKQEHKKVPLSLEMSDKSSPRQTAKRVFLHVAESTKAQRYILAEQGLHRITQQSEALGFQLEVVTQRQDNKRRLELFGISVREDKCFA